MGELNAFCEVTAKLRNRSAGDVDLKDLGNSVEKLAIELINTRRQVSMEGVGGAPDWFGFETDLWKLSRELHEFYKGSPKVRGRNPLSDALARMAEDSSLGKGRKYLVLLLGYYGRGEYGANLGRLLGDSDVYCEAITALTRGRVRGYRKQVSAILESAKKGFIRDAARKYLRKVDE